jgi:transcription antitermination factor NusG
MKWFVTTSPIHHEDKTAETIYKVAKAIDMGGEVVTWVPKIEVKEQNNGHSTTHQEPLYSGYCFVGIKDEATATGFFTNLEMHHRWVTVLRETRGRGKRTYDTYARLTEADIDTVRRYSSYRIEKKSPTLKVGTSVEITDGLFQGHIGKVLESTGEELSVEVYFVNANMVITVGPEDVREIDLETYRRRK